MQCTTLNAASILYQFDPGKGAVGGSCDFLVMVKCSSQSWMTQHKETFTLKYSMCIQTAVFGGGVSINYSISLVGRLIGIRLHENSPSLIFTTIVKTDVWIADMLSWHALR